MENNNVLQKYNDTINNYQEQLDNLRKDGVTKLLQLNKEKAELKRNKLISKEDKENKLKQINEEEVIAKNDSKKNKLQIYKLVKTAKEYSHINYKEI